MSQQIWVIITRQQVRESQSLLVFSIRISWFFQWPSVGMILNWINVKSVKSQAALLDSLLVQSKTQVYFRSVFQNRIKPSHLTLNRQMAIEYLLKLPVNLRYFGTLNRANPVFAYSRTSSTEMLLELLASSVSLTYAATSSPKKVIHMWWVIADDSSVKVTLK